MTDPSVINPQAIADLRELNPGDGDEFLREIVGIFLEDTPKRLAELDLSLAAGDLPKFQRAAHSIKGSSSNLGASALRTSAEKLEQAARLKDVAGLATGLDEVKAEFARAHAALTSLIARQG